MPLRISTPAVHLPQRCEKTTRVAEIVRITVFSIIPCRFLRLRKNLQGIFVSNSSDPDEGMRSGPDTDDYGYN